MRATRPKPAGPPAREARGGKGIGRRSSPRAEAVSDDLRRRAGDDLERRRRVFGLALAAAGSLGVVGLYQSGLVKHLPDPPGAVFDSDRVDASGEAYSYLSTADSALGIASYAVTAALAGMGEADRARQQPWIPLALAAKVAVDAAGAALLTAEQLTKHRRLCFWCLMAAVATLAAVPQTLPEAWAAWARLRAR